MEDSILKDFEELKLNQHDDVTVQSFSNTSAFEDIVKMRDNLGDITS